MTVKIFDTPEVQTFLNAVAGLDQAGGNDRAKQIVHRLVGDLFKLIDMIRPDYEVADCSELCRELRIIKSKAVRFT